MSLCSLIKRITPKIGMLCFVLINSVLLNLSCAQQELSKKQPGDISGGRSGGWTISRKRTSAQRKSNKISERKNKRQQGSGGGGGGQMTARILQTGKLHPTSPASLRG